MGRREKVKRTASKKIGNTELSMTGTASHDDENYKCVSKLAREALRDYISASSSSQNRNASFRTDNNQTSINVGSSERRCTTVAAASGVVSLKSKATALQHKRNGSVSTQQRPNVPEIGAALTKNLSALNYAVSQRAQVQEQQQAIKQDGDHQRRLLQLLGHIPNYELRNIEARPPPEVKGEAKGKALKGEMPATGNRRHSAHSSSQTGIDDFLILAEQAELKEKQENQLLTALSRHRSAAQSGNKQRNNDTSAAHQPKSETHLAAEVSAGTPRIASAFEAIQHIQAGRPFEDVLLQLLNQGSLPLEHVMHLVRQREFQSRCAQQPPFGLYTPSLARAPWNMAPPTGKSAGDHFGNPSEYNKDLARQFQALSAPNQLMPQSNRPVMIHAIHSNNGTDRSQHGKNVGLGQAVAREPTSYDLVPETPRNDELLQRAKYLVHLSQADMSTWRTTRRRFRDEDDENDDDVSLGGSKPRSRKKKAKTAI